MLQILSKQVEPQSSRSLAKTAQTQSNEKKFAGQRHMVYDILASAAAFKAKVQAGDTISEPRFRQRESFRFRKKWIFNDGEATMCTFFEDSKACFVVRVPN